VKVEVEVEFFHYHFHGDVRPDSYDVDKAASFMRQAIMLKK
jgi:hypothetical protein